MTNAQAAEMLGQIADLLDISGANSFRIRSYRQAAESLGSWAEELEEIYAKQGLKGLQSIPDIGKSIAEKLEELLTTGQISQYQELLAQFPDGILQLLQVPGLGPRTVALIWSELEIADIDEVAEAAERQELQELPGLGAKSEEKIVASIARYRRGMQQALLGEILPLGEQLISYLRDHPRVIAAELAGSARRRRATVGDLDLLATSEHPEEVCRDFAASGQLEEVTMAGDTKVSGLLAGGRSVDLRVVAPESYGAALQYFTGSQAHGVPLRTRAQKMNLTVNEYGVFEQHNEEAGEKMAGASEEDVYAAVGLEWIPPELREDRGEIEAAADGNLPDLIELTDIRSDLHLHTTGSDGRCSVEQIAEACRQRGYSYIGITDHSPALRIAWGLTEEEIVAQIQEIARLNERYRQEGIEFRILAGLEADILTKGRVDVPDKAFEGLDFVVGSLHQGFSSDADKMTQRIMQALESGRIDILGHPTGRLLLQREPYGIHLNEVIEAAGELSVAMEINANPHRLDLDDVHARFAQRNGTLLSINTDAHEISHLDFMQYGVYTARRGWIEPQSVVNTWSVGQVKQWLAQRRA